MITSTTSNSPVDSPIRQYCFRSSEALSQALNARRQTTVRQLSLEPLRCDLLLIESEPISFSFTKTSCSLHGAGAKSKEHLEFCFILQSGQQSFFAHGKELSQTTLFGFDPTREANLIVPANSIICVVQIQKHTFDSYAELMQRSDLNAQFLKTNFVTLPNNMISSTQAYLKKLYVTALHDPESFTQLWSHHRLEDFIPLLIDSIPYDLSGLEACLQSPRRFGLVKQAEEYMRSHLETPITLMSLCQALYTSERPLTYGFREVYGVSPMAYLKTLRLQAVRAQLQQAEPTAVIAKIAKRFGFQSLGHFSRDYKTMFGELPSETLKQGN